MLFFSPNEKKIEHLKSKNNLRELLRILDGLAAKRNAKDDDRKLLFLTISAVGSLSSINEKLVCDTLINLALGESYRGNFLASNHREAALDVIASPISSYTIKALLAKSYDGTGMLPVNVQKKMCMMISGAGDLSANLIINELETSQKKGNQFLFNLLFNTGTQLALAYLIKQLGESYCDQRVYHNLKEYAIQFGSDAFTQLVELLDKDLSEISLSAIAECLGQIGDINAAPFLLNAKIALQKKEHHNLQTIKNIEKAIAASGFRCTDHQWNHCLCEICGEIRDGYHQFDRQMCVCSICQQDFHDWDVCKCRKCKGTRHEWVSMGGRGIYMGERCERCREEKPWVRDD